MGIIAFAFTVIVIVALVGVIIWGIPKLPQPGQWIVIAFLIVIAACVLVSLLTGYAHFGLRFPTN